MDKEINIYELVDLVRQNDEEAFSLLFQHLRKDVFYIYYHSCSSVVSIDDWESEAMNLLHKTVGRYRFDKNTEFRTMYVSCLKRKATDLLRSFHRKSSTAAGSILSLDSSSADGNYTLAECIVSDSCQTLEEQVLTYVTCDQVLNELSKRMNPDEIRILKMYRSGYRSAEIAAIVQMKISQVQAVRRKARKIFTEMEKNRPEVQMRQN